MGVEKNSGKKVENAGLGDGGFSGGPWDAEKGFFLAVFSKVTGCIGKDAG
jgi:hypothetical protein